MAADGKGEADERIDEDAVVIAQPGIAAPAAASGAGRVVHGGSQQKGVLAASVPRVPRFGNAIYK